MKERLKITILILILSIFISKTTIYAQETSVDGDIPTYEFPVIKPFFYIHGGYRYTDINNATNSAEYEYPHNSVVLGSELRIFSYPYRFYLELDIKNKKDYFGELRYSYKDIIYLRGISRSLFHNLENIRLYLTNSLSLDSPDQRYGISSSINNFFLRFKTPDFPAHLYIEGGFINKEGTQQLRTILGSGWFNNPIRTTQKRNIKWQTKGITVGANSHLGPIEIDFSHAEKRFDVGGDRVFYNNYDASRVRPAGEFPHNLIPELKGSSSVLKIHTSYEGGITASSTFSNIKRENSFSNANANYFIGSGEIQWIPMPKLAFFIKYRHKEVDVDNPSSITLINRSDPYNSYTYKVKPSISSKTDTISGTIRYRPFKNLTLIAEYSFDDIERENAEKWNITESTQRHTISLSADTRILKNLKLKAKYIHKEINNPSYNIEPDRSDEGRLSVSWTPIPQINTFLSYAVIKEKRDNLIIEDENVQNRDIIRDRFLGSITFLATKNLSITTSYSHIRNKTEQDIVYLITISPPKFDVDRDVLYKDFTDNYGIVLNYMPNSKINLNASINHTTGKGDFQPILSPSLSSFSNVKIKETTFECNGEYKIKNGISLGIRYKYTDFNDVINNIYDGMRDGIAHIVVLTISKKW